MDQEIYSNLTNFINFVVMQKQKPYIKMSAVTQYNWIITLLKCESIYTHTRTHMQMHTPDAHAHTHTHLSLIHI